MTALRMYMVDDSAPHEAAVLVFARTARQARAIAYLPWSEGTPEEFLARRALWLRDSTHGYLRACAREPGPHTVDSVPVCRSCELWGKGALDGEGRCPECAAERSSTSPLDAATRFA